MALEFLGKLHPVVVHFPIVLVLFAALMELLLVRRASPGWRDARTFVLQCGAGRVFHSPLGHDVRALAVPAVGALFRRGCAWAAGLDPAAGPTSTTEKTIEPNVGKDQIQ